MIVKIAESFSRKKRLLVNVRDDNSKLRLFSNCHHTLHAEHIFKINIHSIFRMFRDWNALFKESEDGLDTKMNMDFFVITCSWWEPTMMAAERERAQQHDGICVHHAEPAEHTKSAEGFVASAKPRVHHACRSRPSLIRKK